MKSCLGLLLFHCASVAIAQTESAVAPSATNASPSMAAPVAAAPQPIGTFAIGEKSYSNVTLTGFEAGRVSFSHAAGIKTVFLIELSADQVAALNGTTASERIETGGIDLTPPGPEAAKKAAEWIQAAGGVNGLLQNSHTPLMEAVSAGEPGAVKSVIVQGAAINQENAAGRTALQIAEGLPDRAIAELLKACGARHEDPLQRALRLAPKTPAMQAAEKQIQELRARAAQHQSEARKFNDKAASFRAQAAQLKRKRMVSAPEARQIEQQVADLIAQALQQEQSGKTESGLAQRVLSDIQEQENNIASMKEQQARRIQSELEARTRQEEQKLAQAGTPGPPAGSAPTPAAEPESGAGLSVESGSNPFEQQAGAMNRQHQADARTVQSIVDIMESKTALEKEIEREANEKKEKLAKVPPFVKYGVWAGFFVFVVAALWLIGLAFYDNMLWGLAAVFIGPPVIVLYVALHIRETWLPFVFYATGGLLCLIPMFVYRLGILDFFF